ncbi:MAG: hypothetical protein ACOCRC_02135 [Halodesulfurarchaeum sp.]
MANARLLAVPPLAFPRRSLGSRLAPLAFAWFKSLPHSCPRIDESDTCGSLSVDVNRNALAGI